MFTKATKFLDLFVLPTETPAVKPAPASVGNAQPFSVFLTRSYSEFSFPKSSVAESRGVPVAGSYEDETFPMASLAVAGLYPFPADESATGKFLLETSNDLSPGGMPSGGRGLSAMSALPVSEPLAGEPGTEKAVNPRPNLRSANEVPPGLNTVVPVQKEKINFTALASAEIAPGNRAQLSLSAGSPAVDGDAPGAAPVAGRPGQVSPVQEEIPGHDLTHGGPFFAHVPDRPVVPGMAGASAVQRNLAAGIVKPAAVSGVSPAGLSEGMPLGKFSEIAPFQTPVHHSGAMRGRVILQTAREVHIVNEGGEVADFASIYSAPESAFVKPGKIAVQRQFGGANVSEGYPVPKGALAPTGENSVGAGGHQPAAIPVNPTNGANKGPDSTSPRSVAPAQSQKIHSAGDLKTSFSPVESLAANYGYGTVMQNSERFRQHPEGVVFRENLPAGARAPLPPQAFPRTVPASPGMAVNPPVFQPLPTKISPAGGAFLLQETQTSQPAKPGTVVHFTLLAEEPSHPVAAGREASVGATGGDPVAESPDTRMANEGLAQSGTGKVMPPPGQKVQPNLIDTPRGAQAMAGTEPIFATAASRVWGVSRNPLLQHQPGDAVIGESGAAEALLQTGTTPGSRVKTLAASLVEVAEPLSTGTMSRPISGIATANPEPLPGQINRSHSRKEASIFAEDTGPAVRADAGIRTVREPLQQQNNPFFAGQEGGDDEAVMPQVSAEEAEVGTGGNKTVTPSQPDIGGVTTAKLPVVMFRNATQFTGRLAVFFQEQFNQLGRNPNPAGTHLMLQLEPQELGIIRLNLRMKNNRLVGEIETGLAETSTLLHQNQGQLISRLQDMGVQIQEFNIVHNENMADQQQFAREQQQHRHEQAGGASSRAKDPHKADLSPDQTAHRVEAGRIDVMV